MQQRVLVPYNNALDMLTAMQRLPLELLHGGRLTREDAAAQLQASGYAALGASIEASEAALEAALGHQPHMKAIQAVCFARVVRATNAFDHAVIEKLVADALLKLAAWPAVAITPRLLARNLPASSLSERIKRGPSSVVRALRRFEDLHLLKRLSRIEITDRTGLETIAAAEILAPPLHFNEAAGSVTLRAASPLPSPG